jgi:molybdopterin-guanine dinucleotide biosynthesis protein
MEGEAQKEVIKGIKAVWLKYFNEKQINEVLKRFRSVVDYLQKQEKIPSFRMLCQTTPVVNEAFSRSIAARCNSRVEQWCNGRINCAIIGSSGNGKTTMLDEIFPGLSERGLLVTDVTDTTSQALHISFADKPDELNEVFVNSWSHAQMVSLMEDDDVKQQNETDRINIEFLEDRVVVDGSAANLKNMQSFKFPLRAELRPFPTSYRVPTDKLSDKRFLRALTVKQPSDQIDRGSLVTFDGNSYNALQLRAVVKEVRLKDGYKNILRWSKRTPQEAIRLQFVDTPGI